MAGHAASFHAYVRTITHWNICVLRIKRLWLLFVEKLIVAISQRLKFSLQQRTCSRWTKIKTYLILSSFLRCSREPQIADHPPCRSQVLKFGENTFFWGKDFCFYYMFKTNCITILLTQQNFGGGKTWFEGTAPECHPWLQACPWYDDGFKSVCGMLIDGSNAHT